MAATSLFIERISPMQIFESALENTIDSTLESAIDATIASTMDSVASYLPENLELSQVLNTAASYIPAEIDFVKTMQFCFLFAVISLIMGVLGRVVMGRRSSLNHAISSSIGILFIYVVTVCIYTFQPHRLTQLISPLPFVTFFEDYVILSPVIGVSWSLFCTQTLSMIILSFLVNLLDSFLPKGNNLLTWYLYRFFTVALAMILHLLVHWACSTYLPAGLVTYAPMILLGILACMLLLGVVNAIVGITLTMINPFLGGIYTFFFSNIIGKQISKAVFSSAMICAVLILLEKLGFTVICISAAAIVSYIPLILILLILWHLLGHVL